MMTTAVIPTQKPSREKIPQPLIRKYSKASVARMCQPPVSSPTATKYHRLAIAHVPEYRKAFLYEWEGEIRIDESAEIPETHIPVIQRIRTEYIRQGEHRPTDEYVLEWLQQPDTQAELTALIDPILALLYVN